MKKKAMSAIVATVLIILITIVAAAVLWFFISPNVETSLKESASEKAELSIETVGGYTAWDAVRQVARVQVRRGVNDTNLTGIKFIFITNGISSSETRSNIPQLNGLMVYEFILSEKPTSISIAPITSSGVGAIVSSSTTMGNYSNHSRENTPSGGGGGGGGSEVGSSPIGVFPIDGFCGSLNNCSSGMLQVIPDNIDYYLWNCLGSNGGADAACQFAKILPIEGFCGSLNNCTIGNFLEITDNSTHYLWNCLGLNGGTNTSCNKVIPVNGVCNITLNTCIAGTLLDFVDNSTHYLWNCTGTNGGASVSCNSLIPVIPVNYCVAKDGTGTYSSITAALNSITPGQTCLVKAGNYSSEGRITVSRSGTSGNLLTLEGVPNATTNVTTQGFTINGNYVKVKGFYVTDTAISGTSSYGFFVSGDNAVIENNYVYFSTFEGIVVASTSNGSTIRGNKLQRDGMAGMSISGTNNLVENNEIWGTIQRHPKLGPNYPTWLDADGMRIFGSGHTIRGNYIHNISHAAPENVRSGTYPVPHIDCFQTWDEGEPFTNSIFENNICDNAEKLNSPPNDNMGTHGFMLHGARNITFKNNIFKVYVGINTDNSAMPCSNLSFYNNVFVGDINIKYSDAALSWPSGIGLKNVANAIVKNNIFIDHNYAPFEMTGSNLICTNNIIYKSDGSAWGIYLQYSGCPANGYSNTNPRFVNPSAGNYSLQSNSPAINNGTSVPVTTDIRGFSRPINSKWDIGAYEVA